MAAVALGNEVEIVVLGGGDSGPNRIETGATYWTGWHTLYNIGIIRVVHFTRLDAGLVQVGPPGSRLANGVLRGGVGIELHASIDAVPVYRGDNGQLLL